MIEEKKPTVKAQKNFHGNSLSEVRLAVASRILTAGPD
jgi:hypothetical protein